jgi:hypothetical protein
MARAIKTKVKIADVFFDENLYPRSSYDWHTGYVYSEAMKSGAVFPPIVLAVYDGKNYLVDGKHRIEAFKLQKKPMIDAIVNVGWDKKKIFTEAVKANITHGRMLSPYDKRMVALKMIEMKMSNKEVSELIQVPFEKFEHFIGSRLINTINGEEISSEENANLAKEIGQAILKSGIKQFAGQSFSGEQILSIESAQKEFRFGSQVSLLKELIELLEHNMLDTSNKEVIALVEKLKILIKGF